MEEIWKPVESLSGLLEVSSMGNVRRTARPLIYKDGRKGTLKAGLLRCSVTKDGYAVASLGSKRYFLHRLVAEAFHGKPVENFAYQTVNHIDGNKLNNRCENLEWATYKRNNDHARDAGLCRQHGESTNLSKYTDQFIEAVRNVYKAYSPSYAELGRMFGLTGTHARQIVLHQTRKRKTFK